MSFIISRFTISGDFQVPSGQNSCSICGKEVAHPTGPQFCPEHLPRFEARQRAGVTTDDLSIQWADSLDNWQERPPELDVELGVRGTSTPFRFVVRDGDWVLFERGYGSRPPDGLVVDLRTGEVRRFVAVGAENILDDLLGIHPVPAQAELAAHWGRPDPIGVEHHSRPTATGYEHPLSLPIPLPFPVYGLAGHPLGLTVCSRSSGGTGSRLSSVGLTYTSPRYPDVLDNFELTSLDAKNRWIVSQSTEAEEAPVLWQGELRIAGQLFRGSIERWSSPQWYADVFPPGFPLPEWEMFYDLKDEEINLSGKVQGPSIEEVLGLLQGAVVINERADLLEQYQRELDQESKRMFGE